MIKKKVILIACLFSIISCNDVSDNVSDIYTSGSVENINDFVEIDVGGDSLIDYYQYKYDTLLVLKRIYGTDRGVIRLDAFYYDSLKVGRWVLHDFNGSLLGESNYHNGKLHGMRIIYNDYNLDLIKVRQNYNMGNLEYEIIYNDRGEVIDSVSYQ